MRRIRNVFLFAVSVLSLLFISESIEESVVDSGILISEEVIRNTTNKLFSTLKLKRENPRLSQYIIINKHFASITLQDHDSLNEIVKLSRTNIESNNGSTDFTTAINELLNNDNHNIDENKIKNDTINEYHDGHILPIIETFLKRLRQARELHDVNLYGKINENVLNIIKAARTTNITSESQEDEIDLNTTSADMEYWKPSGRRVFGGQRTKIKHFPFIASIQVFNNFQCAGSIIKSDLIITASSCLQLAWNNRFFRENPAFLSVRVGSSFYSGGGEVISVLEVYFHPEYDPKTLRNNICILRLTRKIKFSWRARRKVRKINIDRHASKLPYNTPGITILGWGAKGRSNIIKDPWNNILSFAVLDIYPFRECQDIYSKEYVTSRNFCAGFMSKGGGACNRDIGDPGIDEGTLVGVVSFGSPVCGAIDAPTVFTKLGYYSTWIGSIMDQEVPSSKARTTLIPETPHIMTHTTLKSTTFKIPPLSKPKPVPINEMENILRMFDDNLFHDFMRTIFDSKEMLEYQDVFKEVKEHMINKILEDGEQISQNENDKDTVREGNLSNNDEVLTVTSPYFDANSAIKIIGSESESVETATRYEYSTKYTTLEEPENGSVQDNVDNNIADMIKNIDLKKIIEEETVAAKYKKTKAAQESLLLDELEALVDGNVSKKNESVLTLLYLSEENKGKQNDNEDKEYKKSLEGARGLSIPTGPFQDLTRSKGNTIDTVNGLPEKELYEILAEVIDDEMRNNETNL